MNSKKLLNWKGEIGVGEGLVLEGEVPPLAIIGLEAVTQHSRAENHTVGELRGGDGVILTVFHSLGVATAVGMALAAEPVEGATHVELFLCGHIEEREVERGAARMTTLLSNIAFYE